MPANFAIPGLMQQESPNADNRIVVRFGEVIRVTLQEGVPLDDLMPQFDIYLSKKEGSDVNLMATLQRNSCVFEEVCGRGVKKYFLRLRTDELQILPGSYHLKVAINRQPILDRSITIRPSVLKQPETL